MRRTFILSLTALVLLVTADRLAALDDWGEAVDVAACYRGTAFQQAADRVEQLVKSHRLNGIILEFRHDKDGKVDMVSNQNQPEGFLVLVQDDTVRAARKLLRAEIAAGLRITLLRRSLFFPERNTKQFIRRNGSWDSPDLAWRRHWEEDARKISEELRRKPPLAKPSP